MYLVTSARLSVTYECVMTGLEFWVGIFGKLVQGALQR